MPYFTRKHLKRQLKLFFISLDSSTTIFNGYISRSSLKFQWRTAVTIFCSKCFPLGNTKGSRALDPVISILRWVKIWHLPRHKPPINSRPGNSPENTPVRVGKEKNDDLTLNRSCHKNLIVEEHYLFPYGKYLFYLSEVFMLFFLS